MNRADIETLLIAAKGITNHSRYVIIGSLSVLGASADPPKAMSASVDVDLYPELDPGRAGEIAKEIGQSTPFEELHGFYADAVSPGLPTLPEGWKNRLIEIPFESGVIACFLDPNDAAISKYVRLEDRDATWIRTGLREGILSMPTIEYRLRDTWMETEERAALKAAIAADKEWLEQQRALQPGTSAERNTDTPRYE